MFNCGNTPFKFHIFNFHQYFDCLLGLDNLQNLNATIDLKNNKLLLPNAAIDIKLKILSNSNNLITIQPRSVQVVKIKIRNITKGEAILPYQKHNALEIPESLIEIDNNQAYTTILNPLDQPVSFDLNEPFVVIPNSEFEINQTFQNLNNFNVSKIKFDLNKVRLDHINLDEKAKLVKLLKSYADIFQFDDKKFPKLRKT